MTQKKNEAAENKTAADIAAEKKEQAAAADKTASQKDENAKSQAEALNADTTGERAVPKKPEVAVVGSAGTTNSGEQRTTGKLLVEPGTEPKAEVKAGRIELNVTPGPQAYSQVLKTSDPAVTNDPRLVKVKVKYPSGFEGAKYLVDGQTYEVSPETAWQFIHEHKIATEVKD